MSLPVSTHLFTVPITVSVCMELEQLKINKGCRSQLCKHADMHNSNVEIQPFASYVNCCLLCTDYMRGA